MGMVDEDCTHPYGSMPAARVRTYPDRRRGYVPLEGARGAPYRDRMCRIAAYAGPPIALAALLKSPPHSLCAQAKQPRELPPGTVGSDGHGMAWWLPDGEGPARYRHTLPIWSDDNVEDCAAYVRSGLIVASTRTASDAMPVALVNTPPFVHDGLALVHNGELVDFAEKLADPLRALLTPAARASLRGNTDTEMISALLASTPGASLAARVKSLLEILREQVGRAGTKAKLNLLVGDGTELVVARAAVDAEPPSLYRSDRADGSTWIASEAFDDGGAWLPVTPGSVTAARAG